VPANVFIGSAGKLPDAWTAHFDLVTCISVLDHVGLDAYGNATDSNLIDDVMTEIERVLAITFGFNTGSKKYFAIILTT
jgi:hypothetical protein